MTMAQACRDFQRKTKEKYSIKVWKDNTVKARKKVQNNGNTKFSRREK